MNNHYLLCEKAGMTSLFVERGDMLPVTLLCFTSCCFIAKRDNSQGSFVDVGFRYVKEKSLKKPQLGYFNKYNVGPRLFVSSFSVDENYTIPNEKDVLVQNYFKVGNFVDVRGLSIGKGFAGAMKRHNFKGLPATHGVSVSHRSHGSTGQRQDPGKVFKGKKMAGQMGGSYVSVMNLKVVRIDEEHNVLFLLGSVPGCKGSVLKIRCAKKKAGV